MKPAPLIAAAVAAVTLASPALACRTPPPAVREALSQPELGFTARVASSERSPLTEEEDAITVTFDIVQPILGAPPSRITTSGSVRTDGEIVISSCGGLRPYGWELAALAVGEDVIISAVEMPEDGVVVRAAIPLSNPRGQALSARMKTQAAQQPPRP